MNPCITVVMPAYNAETTIETALKSIRMQTVADRIEILVIDGGSTDATREIALRYGAIVLNNPRRLPEPAKQIGVQQAKGRYLVKMDTDEAFVHPDQLEKRLQLFTAHPDVRCVVCDRMHPGAKGGLAARYVCVCGDPFTQFVYRQKGGVLDTFRKNIAEQSGNACILRFGAEDPTPIGDGGTTMIDLDWTKKTFPDSWKELRFICGMTSHIIGKTGCCGCISGDDVQHFVKAGFTDYLAKLRFRVVNNLFHPEESGYSARTERAPAGALSHRKYGFVLYAATLIGPCIDSIRLAWRYRDLSMLLHIVYVYYVCLYIAWCLVSSKLGRTIRNTTYGQ